MTILVIAEHDNASLTAATLNTVGAAAVMSMFLDKEIHVLVAGHNAQGAADAAASVAGTGKVLLIDAPQLADGLAENIEAAVLGIAKSYSHIVLPATAYGRNIASRLAAKLGVALIRDITAVESAGIFERAICADKVVTTVESHDPVRVITVRATAFDPVATEGGSAMIERIEARARNGAFSAADHGVVGARLAAVQELAGAV